MCAVVLVLRGVHVTVCRCVGVWCVVCGVCGEGVVCSVGVGWLISRQQCEGGAGKVG